MSERVKKPRKPRKSRGRKDRSPLDLTDFQTRFVAEYLVDLCGADAARRAGSKAKEPKKIADGLFANPKVAKAVADAMAARAQRVELNADMIVAELKKIAFANVSKYIYVNAKGQAEVNLSKMTVEDAAVINEIRVEDIDSGRRTGRRTIFKLHDKIAALQLLGKHLGMFVDKSKIEHSGAIDIENAARDLELRLMEAAATVGTHANPYQVH